MWPVSRTERLDRLMRSAYGDEYGLTSAAPNHSAAFRSRWVIWIPFGADTGSPAGPIRILSLMDVIILVTD